MQTKYIITNTGYGMVAALADAAVNQMAAYALTYMAGVHGSISGSTTQLVLPGGNGSAVTAVADDGYHFVNWSDASTSNPRTDMSVTGNISVTANFAVTSSGGHGSHGCYINPSVPTSGFKMSINGGAFTTSNRNVLLGFNAGNDVKKMAISMTGDFTDASQENHVASKQWDLCSKLGRAIKNLTCSDGIYKI